MINKKSKNTTEKKNQKQKGTVYKPVITSVRGGTVILEEQSRVCMIFLAIAGYCA